jgi:HD superfamily phosphohydrolase
VKTITKIIKDPIYGYIEIEDGIVRDVIDPPNFQRLRSVRQTSYAPLYPSAEHSRFSHSLGVYYLAKRTMGALETDLKGLFKKHSIPDYYTTRKVFLLAALLHDVGHAPFSHTGEIFYDSTGGETLSQELVGLLDDGYKIDIEMREHMPAPHEMMSAIVGLDVYKSLIPKGMRDFFVRCITGDLYYGRKKDATTGTRVAAKNGVPDGDQILNCFISLLNSSTIDVDRLDYLLRDIYIGLSRHFD